MESIIARYMRQRREFAYPQPSSYTKRYLDDSHGDYTIMYQEVLQEAHDLHQPEPTVVLTRRSINRCRVEADARMMQDYFNPGCRFGPKRFKARHGLPRELFLRFLPEICAQDEDFRQWRDACNIPGHSPHMKILAVMKHLAKGVAADSLDDYTGMAASIIYMYVKKFMDALLWLFNDRYMRRATTEDTKRLLAENEARGFPGMLGSLDCTHWEWRWFWHCDFGAPDANNDLNVLDQSGLFDREKNALDPPCEFSINGHVYRHGYYLVDEIYNEMPGVVHGYKRRQTMPTIHKKFNEYHSAKRKDVERAFGGLKAKWDITEHIWKRHIQGLRDGEVDPVEVHDALPISDHGTTDVDEDADIYPSDDNNFYQNGE
ncbi:uncharacterized protein LOC113316240 [Papaver somniferum]|uniref:uncharacterized protein LOC113316240 n=1 Tax=Papaver somniferum TaxID=3469 RepID=UPI000E70202D|nr:uncharacterized protein LOC113316240 [Papaver somniferum]